MPIIVFHSPEEWKSRFGPSPRAALTVGNFDGLHLGHQKILNSVVERGRARSLRAGAITFDPHPLRVLRPDGAPRMIQTLAQRLDGFEKTGLDAALVLRFDRALSQVSPEDFIRSILVDCLRVADMLVGSNFRFGRHGVGDVALLSDFGAREGFEVETIAPVEIDGQVVSSTAIRNAVEAGSVAKAAALLGRPFALTGEIRTGAGRGRTILFPTLNLLPEQELLPKLGVYATETVFDEQTYMSVTNVGMRPTFGGRDLTVESHLFGFSDQVTSGRMEIRFHERLREEKKFSGPDELRAQIARDIAVAREYFSKHGARQIT